MHLLTDNPITQTLHESWRQKLKHKFKSDHVSEYLSLLKYIETTPQNLYSQEAYHQYLLFLESTRAAEPVVLAQILNECEEQLSLSNKILNEICQQPIHDTFLPHDYNELINLIDEKIHYNLLKLYETPLYNLSCVVAKYYWIKHGKNQDGLDLYNSVKELKNIHLPSIETIYKHNVRNGIAHGKIVFRDLNITYIDRKGNKEEVSARMIIDYFDKMVDIVNGFCLALKVFYFNNDTYLKTHGIRIPRSFLTEELQAKVNAPHWTVHSCLESTTISDQKQLIVYIKNDYWSYTTVLWSCFFTAYWTERLTQAFERIFISMHCSHSKSPTGYAAFNALQLKGLREDLKTNLEDYKGVLENNLLFFFPKIIFPRIVYRLSTLITIMRLNFPIAFQDLLKHFSRPFTIRQTQLHSKKYFTVITDTSVVIKPEYSDQIENLVRQSAKRIIRSAIKFSRRKCSVFSRTRYLPVRYIRVNLFEHDLRLRNLRSPGLIPDLIGTIEVNTSKIKTIDIFNGKVEQNGKYRIVWNSNWKKVDTK